MAFSCSWACAWFFSIASYWFFKDQPVRATKVTPTKARTRQILTKPQFDLDLSDSGVCQGSEPVHHRDGRDLPPIERN